MSPLILDPVLVPKPWGGRRLAAFGKQLPDEAGYGESWELADLPSGNVSSSERSRTPVASGPHAGETLRSLIARHGSDVLGSVDPTGDGDFPLLVKLLDAREHLSVQVHPTAEYVSANDDCWLKTESWYVVDADPGAVIYKGFRQGVTMGDVRAAAGTSRLVDLLHDIEVAPGEFHHMPAGIVHALGAGVLIAEWQTPSDTTFRLYDWADEYGREERQAHVEQALDTLVMEPAGAVALSSMVEDGRRTLVETPHYWIREHRLTDGPVELRTDGELRVLMVVRGEASLAAPGTEPIGLTRGATVVLPAAISDHTTLRAVGECVVLESGLVDYAS